MPTGSSARISSIFAVHGRIAENTCCSRMRRAISCVYCPPKSSTTIPPSSVLGTIVAVTPVAALALAAIMPPLLEVLPLLDDKVHQLIGNHYPFDDLFAR